MLEPMPSDRLIDINKITGATEFLMSHAKRSITGPKIVIGGSGRSR